jgi:acyl carrier protein
MENTAIRAKLLELLTAIAPDIEPASVDPDRDLRDQFDFDSMDALHFAEAISGEFGIEIAETESRKLVSLGAAAELVQSKLGGVPRRDEHRQ